MVGKSKEVGFKARKKLLARKRECSARVGRSRAGDYSGVVCVRSDNQIDGAVFWCRNNSEL